MRIYLFDFLKQLKNFLLFPSLVNGGYDLGALSGIRVIDVGLLVQGPQAGQTLVDLGAEVIKVELPLMGDMAGGSQYRWRICGHRILKRVTEVNEA